mgnify:CR=1 FL=1
MKLGLNVVKFFPAGVYGGLKAMKSLSAPFGGVKFIPTGGNFDAVTALCREASEIVREVRG